MRPTLSVFAALALGVLSSPGLTQATRIEVVPSPTRLRSGVDLGGVLYFSAESIGAGRELWRSDGTAAGTRMVLDLDGTSRSSITSNLVRLGGHIYFGGVDPIAGPELFRSDGTAAGTELVAEIRPGSTGGIPEDLTVAGGLIFFSAYGPQQQELWRSDGSDTGTFLLRDIDPAGSSTPHSFLVVGDVLYFTAREPTTGRELWKTDGTPAGTVLAVDAWTGGLGSSPTPIAALDGELVFGAFTGEGSGLWITDDSPRGATRLADLSLPGSGFERGGLVLFAAFDLTAGRELWRTDGTPAGTFRVLDLNPGAGYGVYELLGVLGDTVLMVADDGVGGTELWRTDGTPGGTALVKDIRATGGSDPRSMETSFSSRFAYFRATDDPTGRELWRTDGTAVGTTLFADLWPGTSNSNPFFLGAAAGKVFYSAFDGSNFSLWLVDVGATARPVGVGCGEPGRVPILRADDPVLGAVTTIRGANGVAGAAGHLLASGVAAPIWTPGIACEIYFDPALFVVLAPFTTTSSEWSIPLPIPALPALTGLTLTVQAVLAPTPSVFGFDLTNGVELTFGL